MVGYGPGYYGGPYPYGGAGMYGGWYQPAVEVDYQRATVYTTLFDVQTAKPVWTFNVPTFNPATVRQDMPRVHQPGRGHAAGRPGFCVRNPGAARRRRRGFVKRLLLF